MTRFTVHASPPITRWDTPGYGRSRTVAHASSGRIYVVGMMRDYYSESSPYQHDIPTIWWSDDFGVSWSYEYLADKNLNQQMHLAIGLGDVVSVVYDANPGYTYYQEGVPGNWSAPVAPFALNVQYPSICIDQENTKHIAAAVWFGSAMYYRSRDTDGNWSAIYRLPDGGGADITNDNFNRPHIIYSDNNHIYRDGLGIWQTPEVFGSSGTNWGSAWDDNSNLHMSFSSSWNVYYRCRYADTIDPITGDIIPGVYGPLINPVTQTYGGEYAARYDSRPGISVDINGVISFVYKSQKYTGSTLYQRIYIMFSNDFGVSWYPADAPMLLLGDSSNVYFPGLVHSCFDPTARTPNAGKAYVVCGVNTTRIYYWDMEGYEFPITSYGYFM